MSSNPVQVIYFMKPQVEMQLKKYICNNPRWRIVMGVVIKLVGVSKN